MSDVDVIITAEEELEGIQLPNEVFESDEDREECVTYLLDELSRAKTERAGREKRWAKWRRQRNAQPKNATASYPWDGASNLEAPDAMSTTDIIFAQMKGRYNTLDPLFNVTTSLEKHKAHAAAIGEIVNYCAVAKDQMNLRHHNNTIMKDTVSLGNQIGDVFWDVTQVKYNRNGEEILITTHDGPAFKPERLEDFYVRAFVEKLDNAPWYGLGTNYYKHELEQFQQNGYFVNIEQIIDQPVTAIDDNKAEQNKNEGDERDFSGSGQYYIIKFSLFWDVDKDGVSEDITVWIEPETQTVLREEYNDLGFRSAQHFPYVTEPYEFYAHGVGGMIEQQQEALTSSTNMAFNSAHLNSLQVIITRQGTKLGEATWKPMSVEEAESPQEDVKVLNFPDVTNSARVMAEDARNNIIRSTGVNYAMAGLPDMVMKSRFSPSGYDQQASTGASFLELMSKNFDDAYGELGQKIFYLLLAYKDRTRSTLFPKFSTETQDLLEEVFQMSEQDIRQIFSFTVAITPMDETEEAKQQKVMMLNTLYSSYIQQMIGITQMIGQPNQPPQMQEMLIRGAIGYSEMMQSQISDLSDMNPQQVTLYVEEMKLMVDMMDMQKNAMLVQAKEQLRAMEQGSQSGMAGTNGVPSAQGTGGMAQGAGVSTQQPMETGGTGQTPANAGGIEVLG